jgi:hypothetical protein
MCLHIVRDNLKHLAEARVMCLHIVHNFSDFLDTSLKGLSLYLFFMHYALIYILLK